MNVDALMMHGVDWRGEDLAGWDGARLWSRGGIRLDAPPAMLEGLPAIALDCELYAGRGRFVDALRACSGGHWSEDLGLMVFDAPDCAAPAWTDRLDLARQAIGRARRARAVEVRCASGTADAIAWMREIRAGARPALPGRPHETTAQAQKGNIAMPHTNRSKANRNAWSNPMPAEVRTVLERAGLSQQAAAELIYAGRKSMENWVAEGGSEQRAMHPGLFELLKIKTGQMPPAFYRDLLAMKEGKGK